MSHQSIFNIDPQAGYFHCGNVDLISYSEYDPSQHQSGLVLLMNDRRIATCGDFRFEQTPGSETAMPALKIWKPENVLKRRITFSRVRSEKVTVPPAGKSLLKKFSN